MQFGASFGAGYNHRLKCDGVFTVTQPTLSLDASVPLKYDLKFICVNAIPQSPSLRAETVGFAPSLLRVNKYLPLLSSIKSFWNCRADRACLYLQR